VLHFAKFTRQLSVLLVLIKAILGMFITNDVALLTMVPLTLLVAKKASFDPLNWIVVKTIAANIGSSLTPFGNPQNLYLFNFYKIPIATFLTVTLGFVSLGLTLVFIYVVSIKNHKIDPPQSIYHFRWRAKIIIFIFVFIANLLAIIRLSPFLLPPCSLGYFSYFLS